MSEMWIHLDHPCREVHLCEAETEEDARILAGQGYVPLEYIRTMANMLSAAILWRRYQLRRYGSDARLSDWDFSDSVGEVA